MQRRRRLWRRVTPSGGAPHAHAYTLGTDIVAAEQADASGADGAPPFICHSADLTSTSTRPANCARTPHPPRLPRTPQSMIATPEFQHILRILNTNVDGRQRVMYALTAISGVGRRLANIMCKKADVDMYKR